MAGFINIGNVRTHRRDETVVIRVDRGTPLGNPYTMYKEEARDKVCNKYDHMFWYTVKQYLRVVNYFGEGKIDKTDPFIDELKFIYYTSINNDITLLCWCFPKRCHARTIKKFILMLHAAGDNLEFDDALKIAVVENAELQTSSLDK